MLTQLYTSTEAPSAAPVDDYDARYADRACAGRQLATLLERYRGGRAVVLALPPGGVLVGGEVARALRLPVDVLLAREFAIRQYPFVVAGAVSEAGGLCFNRALLRLPRASLAAVWNETRRAQREVAALVAAYRSDRALPSLARHPVILVDDGLGSGLAQLAALVALRRFHPQRCIVATPGGTPAAQRCVAQWADELVLLGQGAGGADAGLRWQSTLGDDDAAIAIRQYQARLTCVR